MRDYLLAVDREVAPVINRLQSEYDVIVATQDWHPRDDGSFDANDVGKQPLDQIALRGLPQPLWLAHRMQETPGADFASGLDRTCWDRVFQKGMDSPPPQKYTLAR